MKKKYYYAKSQILAQDIDDGASGFDKYFYLHDRLGSVRQVLNESGAVVNTYTYNPFGEDIASECSETVNNPWKYTGQWYDPETGQYYLRARQYDPHIARFTTRDPIEGDFKEPMTLHPYLYCLNDPINYVDLAGFSRYEAYHYDYYETEDIIKGCTSLVGEGVDGIIAAFGFPFGDEVGRYDFRALSSESTFVLGTKEMLTSSSFGNYLAGYSLYFNYGKIGAAGAYGAGDVFALVDSIRWPSSSRVTIISYLTTMKYRGLMFDDFGSKYWVTRGILDAHKKTSSGGIKDKITEIGYKMNLRVLEAGYAYEKFLGGPQYDVPIIGGGATSIGPTEGR